MGKVRDGGRSFRSVRYARTMMWNAFQGIGVEQRLSGRCFVVLGCRSRDVYGG